MTILKTAKISKGFRVTIPKEVREIIELEEGDEIVFFTVENVLTRVCFRKTSRK
jgi:AbrB family looped-hinge helix DNA binding protein